MLNFSNLFCFLSFLFLQFYLINSIEYGIVSGGIYTAGPQSMVQNGQNIACEFQQLGARWVRIESDWAGVSVQDYQKIVSTLKQTSLKVVVIVGTRFCSSDTDTAAIDNWISSFLNHLNYLATQVFVGSATVDAFELANEPNIFESGCGDGVARYRVSPNAFAYLCRRTMEWKQSNNIKQLIISGGILNTYTTEDFWGQFYNSGAFFSYPGSAPFDYFGVHPYDSFSIDQNCVNSGSTSCFSSWSSTVKSNLITIVSQLNAVTKTSSTKLFITEFGWQLPAYGSCSANSNCVINENQVASGMVAAANAFGGAGNVQTAIWYDYRDDINEKFGLRSNWTGYNYPAKQTVWHQYKSIAGGSGTDNADFCWS
eukprot:TRINITY_DN294_c1_g1_i1.p1 TRINITY_DN294_c1_g1~~TRINITY_DN294_c1_g1_i1.p1  ORF type:complete len:369 (-),score=187.98 TRINITY_DN294_c1_g1_i1:52-1158(-)